ncbi:unnamed protein product [Effrenium voratum]|nr:unnamed protein product [Effrenium voratum]
MLFDIEALDLIWPWTPLMPTVYLEPGTTFRVNLTVPKPCPNVFVVLFSGKQLTDILPMLSHNGHGMSSYVAASWRASLAQSVNATFQVHLFLLATCFEPKPWQIFSEDAQSLGILTAAPQLNRSARDQHGSQVLCSALKVCSPQRYMLTLFTVNSLCSLVVIVSTNFNIFLLSRQLIEANASQEAGVLYAKLQAYITFRVCFLYFVMIPVICGTALRIISWRSMWMVKETLEWCVLSVVLWLWRPGYMKAVRVFQLSAAPPSESEAESVEDVEE